MFNATGSVRRFARFATLAVVVCHASISASTRAADPNGGRWAPQTLAASVWVSTLPGGLMLSAVPPTWQLVSMIAGDIDNDGDLDVVANDGSLNLVVWINDGTGRLSRQSDRQSVAGPQRMSGPGLTERPAESQTVATVPSSALPETAANASLLMQASRSRLTDSSDVLLPLLLSTRSPRGPPLSSLAI